MKDLIDPNGWYLLHLKLLALIETSTGPFSQKYINEKVRRIADKEPIIIHPTAYREYLNLESSYAEQKNS